MLPRQRYQRRQSDAPIGAARTHGKCRTCESAGCRESPFFIQFLLILGALGGVSPELILFFYLLTQLHHHKRRCYTISVIGIILIRSVESSIFTRCLEQRWLQMRQQRAPCAARTHQENMASRSRAGLFKCAAQSSPCPGLPATGRQLGGYMGHCRSKTGQFAPKRPIVNTPRRSVST